MDELLKHIFTPPPMPPISLPWGAKAVGVMDAIRAAFELAYWEGVKDGLMWGVIFSLGFVLILQSWRSGAAKGFVNAIF